MRAALVFVLAASAASAASVLPSTNGAAFLAAHASPFAQDDEEPEQDGEAGVTRDLAALVELGDDCPAYVVRRLANDDDARVREALGARFGDTERSWSTRALALVAWARHVRLHHADDADVRNACLAAIETWLGEGAGAMQRAAALEAADELGEHGEAVLRRVVETAPDTLDRVRALELFADGRELPDYTWFKELYERGGRKAGEDEQREYAADGPLARLREIAFDELAEEMRAEEVESALEDRSLAIRVRANRIQEQRDDDTADERALAIFEDEDEPIELRLWAAAAISRRFDRERHYTYLFEYGVEPKCDPELRNHIATRIDRAMPRRVLDIVRKQLGKGKLVQKLFAIDALPLTVMGGLAERPGGGIAGGAGDDDEDDEERAFDDEKVLEALRDGLSDKDAVVRTASADALVERRDFEALDALQKAARKAKLDGDIALFLESRVALGDDDDDLATDAAKMAGTQSPVLRLAGLLALVALDPDAHEEQLRLALELGPANEALALVEVIEERRWARGVGLLVAALERPERHVREAARRALWRLTARDEGPRAADWSSWWTEARATFTVATEEAVEEFEESLGDPLRRESVAGELFGIALEHTSVAVALDLGPEALSAPVQRRVQQGTVAASGLELVRRELEDLAGASNSSLALRLYSTAEADDGPWLGFAPLAGDRTAALATWFDEFPAVRTSNIPALTAAALADRECEALVIVTSGAKGKLDLEELETQRRQFVVENRGRALVVHGVAVGTPSRELRWLCESSGGTYVFVP
jgi:hypothetical protein